MVVIKVSPSVILERLGNDDRLNGYFCLEVKFNLSHTILSDLEIQVLGKGYLLMKQILKGILLAFGEKQDVSDTSGMILLKTSVKLNS